MKNSLPLAQFFYFYLKAKRILKGLLEALCERREKKNNS